MYFITFVLKNLQRRFVRSFLTIVGIAIAVMVVICLVGISTDFRESLIHSYEQRGVDLIVVRSGRTQRLTSKIDQNVAQRIQTIPGVKEVEGGLVDLASFDEVNLTIVPIMGRAAESFLMRDLQIRQGRKLAADDASRCLLGTLLAEQLGKHLGESVDVEGEPFEIVGIYESYNTFDNSAVMVLRRELQRLMDCPGEVTGFSVRLDSEQVDPELPRRVETQIESLTDDHGKSWGLSAMPTRDFMNSTFEMQAGRAMGWVTSLIALLIGAVGMLNTMLMSVFERTKELGILRAIGWRKWRIMLMILGESLTLSVIGAALGALAALATVTILHQFHSARIVVPPHLNLAAVVQGAAIALAVGTIGGLYPAFRAMHIPPTEAIRHE